MKIFIVTFLTLLFACPIFAQREAQVTVTLTFLRKTPDSISEKIQTVQKGDKLILEKSQDTNGWYYVSIANRTIKGWIRKDTFSTAVKKEVVIQRPRTVVSAPSPTVKITPPINSNRTTPQSPPPTTTITRTVPLEMPIEDEEIIRVNTEEVSLNVRVVDTNNRAVNNLNQSHFKIYEDGVLQPVTSLTTTEMPMINALVIDNSRSLRSQLRDIIEAGKTIVATNRPADESAVIRFVSADKIEVVQDFTLSKASLYNGLENLFVEGGQTAIVDAVYQAAKKIDQYKKSAQKDDVKMRALILVSDGDDRSSSRKEEELFELLRKSQVQIFAIGFVNNLSKETDASGVNRHEKAKAFLTRLTQETGGKIYLPNSINELPLIASNISKELHTQYLISYTPTNETRDGTFRKISVVIDDGATKEKRIAIARTGRISAAK